MLCFLDLSLGSMKLWKHLSGALFSQPRFFLAAVLFLLLRFFQAVYAQESFEIPST